MELTCPKCGGGTYLVDEELVRVVENTDPMKVIAKAIYQCRSCGERFSRLVVENIDAKKVQQSRQQGIYSGQPFGVSSPPDSQSSEGEAIDQLKFF
jgi:phage terminase large subunit GpA-like protein